MIDMDAFIIGSMPNAESIRATSFHAQYIAMKCLQAIGITIEKASEIKAAEFTAEEFPVDDYFREAGTKWYKVTITAEARGEKYTITAEIAQTMRISRSETIGYNVKHTA